MKSIVICDVDGTVANIQHRLHYIKGPRKDYDKFYDECVNDIPLPETIEVIQQLANAGYEIVFMSGRPDSHRQQTRDWLRLHFGWCSSLYMRQAGDYRADHIVKAELFEQMLVHFKASAKDILCAFDDRPSIVALWRSLGITTYAVSDWDETQTLRPSVVKAPTLTLLVGPAGAGKSTWVNEHYVSEAVVSSDNLRWQLFGNILEQRFNDYLFKTLHAIVKTRLDAGLSTCVDATNLRNADRKKFLQLAPKDATIEYVVINRSMKEKIASCVWRPVSLLERHEQIFTSNLKDILKGDGDARVIVKDLRT